MSTYRATTVRMLTTFMAGLIILCGLLLNSAATADAATGGCKDGRCTVYLSKAETKALSQGRASALPAAVPWQIKGAYAALVAGHRWIAGQYANRGWCFGLPPLHLPVGGAGLRRLPLLASIMVGTLRGIQRWDPNTSSTVEFPYAGMSEEVQQILPASYITGATVVTLTGLKILRDSGVSNLNNTGGGGNTAHARLLARM